jgi:4-hydroxybenzoate polyprenyltransferase
MRKTMIMPIVFGTLTILVAVGYALIITLIPIPLFVKIIIALILTALIIAMIYVLIQRNKELKQEESIDISKY